MPFKFILNDMYSKDISKKIRSSLENKKKQGLYLGSKAPYGYDKFNKYYSEATITSNNYCLPDNYRQEFKILQKEVNIILKRKLLYITNIIKMMDLILFH